MYAAAGGYDQAVEMLINVGANPELKKLLWRNSLSDGKRFRIQ